MTDNKNIELQVLRYKRRIYKFFRAYVDNKASKNNVLMELEKVSKEYYNEDVEDFKLEAIQRIEKLSISRKGH